MSCEREILYSPRTLPTPSDLDSISRIALPCWFLVIHARLLNLMLPCSYHFGARYIVEMEVVMPGEHIATLTLHKRAC